MSEPLHDEQAILRRCNDRHQYKHQQTEGTQASMSSNEPAIADTLPVADDVTQAVRTLKGVAHVTPVMTSTTLNQLCGAEVFLKCENLQRIGAFKFRGAYNALSNLSEPERRRGVVTHSSGNHAGAIALTGKLLDIKTVVVMPSDAPQAKRAAATGYGATVVQHHRDEQRREDVSAELMEKHGYTLIPPYNHLHVIAGQGSAAAELHSQIDALDTLLVPCGGGGLLSGSAIATKALASQCRVIGVEPEHGDDAVRSFKTGTLQSVSNPQTIADGTRTESLGSITFPIVMDKVDDMVAVSEQAIADAVSFLLMRTKMLVEPSGALGVAALLSAAVTSTGRTGVILSGGNVDASTLCTVMRMATPSDA